jgi:hypothetical protein
MTAASLALFPLLAGPRRTARVLTIVPGAVYLQLDPIDSAEASDGKDRSGAVIALLEPDAVQLPFGLVLPEKAAGLIPVSVAGSPVSRGVITLGWGFLDLAGTRLPVLRWWNPGVPVLELPPPALGAGDRPASGAASSPGTDSVFNPETAEGLAALAAGEPERAVRQLIGVGSGLIPAGDDVLVGALAPLAAWTPDAPERRRLAEAVVAEAGRTTVISAALLQAAVAGSVVPELGALLTAIGTAEANAVEAARAELIRVGPGSGAATAAGALQQFERLRRTVRRAA